MPRGSLARRLVLWAPPVLYMGVIFLVSAQSNPMPELTEHVWDKLIHLGEYGVLGFLFARAIAGEGFSWMVVAISALLLTSAYGVTDEYHQSFVPNRNADAKDWMADTLGAGVAIAASAVLRRSRPLDGRAA